MNSYIAFFGTGPCDPNKGLIETGVLLSVIATWVVLVLLLQKTNKTSKSKAFKYSVYTLIICFGVVVSILAFVITQVGLACSGSAG